MALVIDIADAVTAEINAAPGGTFSLALTAVRKVLPVYDLSDLDTLKVTVVPKAVEITAASRSSSQYDIAVDIGVQKKLGKDIDAEIVALVGLVDEIADYLRQRALAAAPYAIWAGIVNEPVYSAEHLADNRTFTSVLTVTYRAMK